MKKVLMLLVAGTMLSGFAAYYAGARVVPAEKPAPGRQGG